MPADNRLTATTGLRGVLLELYTGDTTGKHLIHRSRGSSYIRLVRTDIGNGSGDILNLAAGITNDYYLIQIQGVFFQDDIEITLVRYRDNLFPIAQIRKLYRAVFR